jgi:hypothetical protein
MGKVSAGRKGAKQSKETGERSNGNCFRPTLQVVRDLDRSVPTNEHLVIHFWIVGQPGVERLPFYTAASGESWLLLRVLI